jgi:predicted Zn-dependent protease
MTKIFSAESLRAALAVLMFSFAGCSPEMRNMSAGLLSSTGLVSSSQANSLVTAVGKGAASLQGLSEEQEYYLGRAVAATILDKYHPVNDPALLGYVNRVGMALAANSDRPETFGGYHFMVLDTNEVNALSGPGGFVFITRGLLSKMPDEDALASVLGHEIGHIVLAHGVSAISKANMTQALLILGKEAASSYGNTGVQELTTAFGDSVNDIVSTLLTKGFSRSQEYEADRYSAGLLQKTGYNPSALLTMLDALEKGSQGAAGGWYSTHPAPEKRKSEIASIVKPIAPDAGEKTRAARFKSNVKTA